MKITINITSLTLDNTYYSIEVKQYADLNVLSSSHWIHNIYSNLRTTLTKKLTREAGGYEIFNSEGFEFFYLVDKDNKDKFIAEISNLHEIFNIKVISTTNSVRTVYEIVSE